jgi:hypothetical protein
MSRHRTAQNPWKAGQDGLGSHVILIEDGHASKTLAMWALQGKGPSFHRRRDCTPMVRCGAA